MSEEIGKSESDEMEGPGPTSERWDPLGADNEEVDANQGIIPYESEVGYSCSSAVTFDSNRIKSLEDEQEILTTSLMALTSHFAQVQFRLRQIVEAPAAERDQLLKNLEEFAFRGIPEITGILDSPESEEVISNLEHTHQQQFELIERLKRQLTELENFAYESGAPVLPQSILLEKQKIIIDELKSKLNLNVNETDLPQLSSEDLKSHVETAIGEFVGPLKMKEQLVAQLKTQITDLERFIAFLQCDSEETKFKTAQEDTGKQSEAYNTYVMKKKKANSSGRFKEDAASTTDDHKNNESSAKFFHNTTNLSNPGVTQSLNSKAHSLLDKASTLLQMFAIAQFGCGSNRATQKNSLKKTSKVNHWGDTRAQLEVDIQEVISLAMALKRDREKLTETEKHDNYKSCSESYYDYSNDSDDGVSMYSGKVRGASCMAPEPFSLTNVELTSVVRRNFAVTLQKLIQHGLRNVSDVTTSLVPFMGCLNPSGLQENFGNTGGVYSSDDEGNSGLPGFRQMHAWELILEYYNIKNGDQYNETPARKLSQSFNLDIVGANGISNKQSLLSAIGSIVAMHTPYKRSYNSHFKAFVCAGLNSHKLVQWLNLIFQCTELVNTYYTSWSYVARTGFRDACARIDRLSQCDFDLPVDLAIRQFRNIKDVFM